MALLDIRDLKSKEPEDEHRRALGRGVWIDFSQCFQNVFPEDTVLILYCYVTNQPPPYWFRTVTTLFSLCFGGSEIWAGLSWPVLLMESLMQLLQRAG